MLTKITLNVVSAGQTCQDRATFLEIPNGHLFILADGAGGSGGGSDAADCVIARASRAGVNTVDECINLLIKLDMKLEAIGQTTTVIAVVSNGKIWGASVGDSSVWLVGETSHIDLTDAQIQKPLLGSGRGTSCWIWTIRCSARKIYFGV